MIPIPNYHKRIYRIRTFGRFLGIVVFIGCITYLLLHNLAPFGAVVHYSLRSDDNRIGLGPKERVKEKTYQGETILEQTHDIIYFTTKMPLTFNEATVRVTFKNTHPQQIFFIGFQDKPVWHYEKKLFDVPFLNGLSWNAVGNKPTLYQRGKNFNSVAEFLKNPPSNALIGTYEYDTNIGTTLQTRLLDYTPQKQPTIIDMPFRGKHVLYAYLENEPFNFTLQKQDLNWYEDPDTVTVKIYKENILVYQQTIPDDGIVDNSKKTLPLQEVTIQNPGPDLPENGVYKIIIDANDDTIIHRITTNLSKIVFSGQIFPVKNYEAYPSIFSKTTPTILYTNAMMLSAITYHEAGIQQLFVGDEILKIKDVKNEQTTTLNKQFTQITALKNDVILNMFEGYSAMKPEQFFLPTMHHVFPITKKSDTTLADYIIADYKPSEKTGEWFTSERTFDLQTAYIKNDQLTWAIIAPKLYEKKQKIEIKNVDVTLKKKRSYNIPLLSIWK